LYTRYTGEKLPVTFVVAKSPTVTAMASEPGFARSCATMSDGRDVDAVDFDTHVTQRQRDPSGPDTELRRRAAIDSLGENLTVGSKTAGSYMSSELAS